MIRKQTKVWTTDDGRELRICDMSNKHLANTINMLRRTAAVDCASRTLFFLTCSEPNGDMAQRAFEEEQERTFESTWEDHVDDLYEPMVLDFMRRELDEEMLKDPENWKDVTIERLLGTIDSKRKKR